MFLLNLQSKTPIFQQIRDQILKYIEAGVLAPGDKLPSVREMALDNGINPNTVAKAYQELEKTGYVYNVPKKGVYVAQIDLSDQQETRIRPLLESLKENGITRENILRVLDEVYTDKKEGEDQDHAEN